MEHFIFQFSWTSWGQLLIKWLYDFGNAIKEIRPVIWQGFGVTISHGIVFSWQGPRPEWEGASDAQSGAAPGAACPGQRAATAQVVLPQVEARSLLCWRKCPGGRCVGWQPGRVIFSENSLTYQRAVGGQAPCKWSEVCGHGFKMKPLTRLRFSRALVLGSAVWSVSVTGLQASMTWERRGERKVQWLRK